MTALERLLVRIAWERKSPPVKYAHDEMILAAYRCIDLAGQDRRKLLRFAADDLPLSDAAQCAQHLSDCPGCSAYLQECRPLLKTLHQLAIGKANAQPSE